VLIGIVLKLNADAGIESQCTSYSPDNSMRALEPPNVTGCDMPLHSTATFVMGKSFGVSNSSPLVKVVLDIAASNANTILFKSPPPVKNVK
jgi:hypothetical protein